MFQQYTQDEDYPKFALTYVFGEESGHPELGFQALSRDAQLTDDFEFFAQQITNEELASNGFEMPEPPSMFGVMRKSEQYSGVEMFNFQGMREFEFKGVKATLL